MAASDSEQNMDSAVNPEWEERLVDFTFGHLDAESAAAFEQRLLECRERVTLAEQYRSVTAMLGRAVAPAEPPEGHKTRFQAKLTATAQVRETPAAPVSPDVAAERQPTGPRLVPGAAEREAARGDAQEERIVDLIEARRRRDRSILAPALAMAAAAVILLLGAWIWSLSSSISEQNNRLQAAERDRDTALAQLRVAQGRLDEFSRTLNIPAGYTAFPIAAQAPYTATAMVLFNPETRDVALVANGLQPQPANKVYEFWLFPNDPNAPPVAAQTFNADAQNVAKHTTVAATNVSAYRGFAVSLEDAPGGTAPGGPVLLAGFYK